MAYDYIMMPGARLYTEGGKLVESLGADCKCQSLGQDDTQKLSRVSVGISVGMVASLVDGLFIRRTPSKGWNDQRTWGVFLLGWTGTELLMTVAGWGK